MPIRKQISFNFSQAHSRDGENNLRKILFDYFILSFNYISILKGPVLLPHGWTRAKCRPPPACGHLPHFQRPKMGEARAFPPPHLCSPNGGGRGGVAHGWTRTKCRPPPACGHLPHFQRPKMGEARAFPSPICVLQMGEAGRGSLLLALLPNKSSYDVFEKIVYTISNGVVGRRMFGLGGQDDPE